MAKAATLNFAGLNLNISQAESRTPVTASAVARPTREIIATLNDSARKAAWQAVLATVAEMHDKPVDAKGSDWLVNDDEAARAIRVNFNLIQPDFYGSANRQAQKMTKEASEDAWRQICEMLDKPAPTFTETNDDDSDK